MLPECSRDAIFCSCTIVGSVAHLMHTFCGRNIQNAAILRPTTNGRMSRPQSIAPDRRQFFKSSKSSISGWYQGDMRMETAETDRGAGHGDDIREVDKRKRPNLAENTAGEFGCNSPITLPRLAQSCIILRSQGQEGTNEAVPRAPRLCVKARLRGEVACFAPCGGESVSMVSLSECLNPFCNHHPRDQSMASSSDILDWYMA